ncbi:MAG: hypothetical protein WBE34_01400 [Candidatus Nitrosopolaris sp.]
MDSLLDDANHQYDLSDFWNAADAGNLPAVSFLNASPVSDRPSRILRSNR